MCLPVTLERSEIVRSFKGVQGISNALLVVAKSKTNDKPYHRHLRPLKAVYHTYSTFTLLCCLIPWNN